MKNISWVALIPTW